MRNYILPLISLFLFDASAQISPLKLSPNEVLSSFRANPEKYGLVATDVLESKISDFYTDKANGITHAYVQQYVQGLPIINAVIGLHYNRQNKLVHGASNFVSGALEKMEKVESEPAFEILARNALSSVSSDIDIYEFKAITIDETGGVEESGRYYYYCYYYNGTQVQKACNFIFYDIRTSDWWNIISGMNGQILAKISWTTHCTMSAPETVHRRSSADMASYNTLSFSTESPLYGTRSILLNPGDTLASPFGWHDLDGVAGPENTTTRGNNVLASEDGNADNQPGFSPDGGSSFVFDFDYDSTESDPANYQAYAITNLFVANNLLHDLLYGYGFDEVAGNFQSNTYNRGGENSDEVNADAQDGSGMNNANFSTPPDGSNPRMQMYIWSADAGNSGPSLRVTLPDDTTLRVGRAQFGPQLSAIPISGKLILVDDGVGNGIKGCGSLVNSAAIDRNIAAVQRGDCFFTEKVYNAQLAGALAVVILDTFTGNQVITMYGTDSRITIPSVIVKFSDGKLLADFLSGNAVNIRLYDSSGAGMKTDSDLDLGVIAHEYTHGVSNRLTCGPSITTALNNAEQMGEGWSDFMGLALTVKASDLGSTPRGIGNWLIGQDRNGGGIRTYPYTTNMAKNPHTYKSIQLAAISGRTETHYVGEVWCSILWDLHWKMVEKYGFDTDLFHGTGGNNMTIRLIMDGMKLQKCNPGFVDGRNAILMADSLNYGGANSDLIWQVFARRGLGYSALQGSAYNTADGKEAFDLPGAQQNTLFTADISLASVRPNPTQSELFVEPASVFKIDHAGLHDVLGVEVPISSNPAGSDGLVLDLGHLPTGIYFLRVNAGSRTQVIKIIRN